MINFALSKERNYWENGKKKVVFSKKLTNSTFNPLPLFLNPTYYTLITKILAAFKLIRSLSSPKFALLFTF